MDWTDAYRWDDWESGKLVDTPTTRRLRRRRQERRAGFYAIATWPQLERLVPVCTKSDLAVWLHLRSLQSIQGEDAWISADMSVLRSWGIQDRSYRRAIANLRTANFLEAESHSGRKTRVRLKPIAPSPASA